MSGVVVVTREPVEQQLHRADVQVQLVHVMLTEVTDLQVPGETGKHQQQHLTLGNVPIVPYKQFFKNGSYKCKWAVPSVIYTILCRSK